MPRGKNKPIEREWVIKELREMAKNQDWTYTDNNLFQIWVMRLLHFNNAASQNDEAADLTIALLNEFGSGDGKLDGYFHNSVENTLYLYQTKWPIDTNRSNQEDAQELQIALVNLIADVNKDNRVGTARDGAKSALKEILKNKGSICLRGVSGTTWTYPDALERKIEDQCRTSIPENCEIGVQLLGINDLLTHKTNLTKTLSGKSWPFKFYKNTDDPIMKFPSQGKKGLGDSVVGLISARSIGEAVNKYQSALFDLNVRHFHGTKNKVNKFITKAMADPEARKGFWYGHNGITICCDSFEQKGDAQRPTEIIVKNPQIVNGCQSANSFAAILEEPGKVDDLDEVGVLVRIIQVDADEDEAAKITGNIAWATNNQSAIKDADLRSNDSSQMRFSQLLLEYDPPWFYERKANEVAQFKKFKRREFRKFKESENADRIILRDRYQKAWRAFSGDPAGSVSRSNDVWGVESAQEALYESVFALDRRPCDIIFVSVLFDWTRELFKFNEQKESSEYAHLNAAIETNMNHINYMRLFGKAAGLVQAYTLYMFGFLIEESYGAIDKLDKQTIDYLTSRLSRGTSVAKYKFSDKTKEALKVLDSSLLVIFKTWDRIVDKATDTVVEELDPNIYGGALRDWLKKDDSKERVENYLRKEMDPSVKYISLDS